jgi:glycosyltransferase involved in cell wall biosynthesis
MKILFITPNYPPTFCGVGDYTYHLAQEMARRGIEMHVICSANQKAQSKNETVYPVIKRWNRGGVQLAEKIIQDVKPDWVVIQMIAYAYQPKGLPFLVLSLYNRLKKANVKVATTFHEIRIKPEGSIKKWIVGQLQTYIAHRMRDMSDKVITSIDLYAAMLNAPSDKLSMIPIGSNIPPIDVSPEESAALKKKHDINSTATIICTFGNRDITPYLPAFDKLVQYQPNTIWLVSGRVHTPIDVLKSRDYIRYVGALPAEDIYRHLVLGDIFFMPDPVNEKGEGGTSNKSTSLACACSLNIPIVATKGDLNNALLLEGEKLLLVDINDTDTLYNTFKMCLDKPDLCAKLGNNAYEFYQNHLTWTVLTDKFLGALEVELTSEALSTH